MFFYLKLDLKVYALTINCYHDSQTNSDQYAITVKTEKNHKTAQTKLKNVQRLE